MVMGQVFAAINHRLGEEYTSIALPNQAAKERQEIIPLHITYGLLIISFVLHIILGCSEMQDTSMKNFQA